MIPMPRPTARQHDGVAGDAPARRAVGVRQVEDTGGDEEDLAVGRSRDSRRAGTRGSRPASGRCRWCGPRAPAPDATRLRRAAARAWHATRPAPARPRRGRRHQPQDRGGRAPPKACESSGRCPTDRANAQGHDDIAGAKGCSVPSASHGPRRRARGKLSVVGRSLGESTHLRCTPTSRRASHQLIALPSASNARGREDRLTHQQARLGTDACPFAPACRAQNGQSERGPGSGAERRPEPQAGAV